ncbi:hypothetical protein FHS89_002805 [Rubricella aquisinus]|uniref:Uncharacterized protein n=1 Tax=Rubricella aquisinus TaxID=2028108 RepID=A0A840WRV0_9RHOB|nr:hypothetical protein [Rubricella aquisinus]MBB5516763.1 hypothetical protein [Rubricella aquisinus]
MILRALLILIALSLPLRAVAQTDAPIPGMMAPNFIAALFNWLQDEDELALPVLHAEADQGNIAAQMWLMVMMREPDLSSPYLATLDRAERRALARDSNGTLWQNRLEGAHPAADRLLRSYRRTETLEDLVTLSEADDWRHTIRILASETYPEGRARALIPLIEDGIVPPSLISNVWSRMLESDPSAETVAQMDQQLQASWDAGALPALMAYGRLFTLEGRVPDAEHQRIRTLTGLFRHGNLPARYNQPKTDEARSALQGTLMALPDAVPLHVMCEATCPGSIPTCIEAAFTAQGGFTTTGAGWSPVQQIVANQTFLRTPRGQATALRAGLRATVSPVMMAHLAEVDICYATALEDESLLYQ